MESLSSIAHLQMLDELLKMDFDYEVAEYNRTFNEDNIGSHVNEPDCKYPISICGSGYNALNQLILTISYDTDGDEIENLFEPGSPVEFFYRKDQSFDFRSDTFSDSGVKRLSYTCFVDACKDNVLQIQLPNKSALSSIMDISGSTLIGLRVSVNDTSFRVMHESLQTAMHSDNERFVRLRETLLGNLHPRFRQQPPVFLPWLNAVQNKAVNRAVAAQDVSVVHGPPGTGKTTTMVEAIIETLHREIQVLVCAPSNAAVDWICEQLSKRSVNVLRIGNPVKISDEMLACSYERRYADHPDYPELWQIRQNIRHIEENKSSAKQDYLRHLRKRQIELEIKINADIFRRAQVVSCTLIGSAYHILEHHHFSTLFIDEAAQALEPACWSAILKADRVILSGDHCQLPPTVKCVEAARKGLSNTLMEHLVKTKPECVTLLTTQYRMHRDIMEFSSRWFYRGALRASPEVADRMVHLMDTPLTWIDTASCAFEERQNKSMSRINADEAKLVVHTLRDYVNMIGLERLVNDKIDFGIISPYRAQVRMIRRLLKMQRFYRRMRGQISVNSVDGFQGQERDVIIISMVRDNEKGDIGFLSDLRRMNVAITRARMKLILIGNSETLKKHRFYNALFEHFSIRGQVIEAVTEEE
ncbi:MAG: AAA family ATPase [Bacteroidales bacterium]|nr:AAA family ATPase [Bacteroidales bacterium]